ncbi:MAG: hypothetical protein ACR2JM_16565 [Mycobacterium sp.]
MGYPYQSQYPPAYPPPKPPLSRTDATISIIVLVVTVLGSAGGALMSFLMLAFLDYCPPETCSVNGAVSAAAATVGAVAVIAVTGLVLTISRLSARKTAWPFAVGTLAACVVAFLAGFLAYNAAVGW